MRYILEAYRNFSTLLMKLELQGELVPKMMSSREEILQKLA